VEIVLTVDGDPEGVRPLYEAVLAEPAFLNARLLTDAAPPGALSGQIAEAINLLMHDGGTSSALAAVIVTWIRSQRGKIEVHIAKPAGKITVKASNVPRDNTEALNDFISSLARNIAGNELAFPSAAAVIPQRDARPSGCAREHYYP
jgi:Effector Associated Constant Component 1